MSLSSPLACARSAPRGAAAAAGRGEPEAVIRVVFFDLGDTLIDAKARAWKPGAEATLARLGRAGLRLGVLSNTGQLSRSTLSQRYLPLDFSFGRFESGLVLLSSEVGVEKPSPGIFELAIARAGVPASQILFVGEDVAEVSAARAAGLSARVVRRLPEDLAELGPDR